MSVSLPSPPPSVRRHEGRAGLLAAEPELGAGAGRRVAPPGGALQQEVSFGGARCRGHTCPGEGAAALGGAGPAPGRLSRLSRGVAVGPWPSTRLPGAGRVLSWSDSQRAGLRGPVPGYGVPG